MPGTDALHSALSGTNIHVPYAFSYADTAAREAAAGLVAGDVGKLALQQDDNSLWLLTDDAPVTWVAVGGAGGGGDVATDAIWDAAGDLAVGSGADAAARKAVGATGTVLGVQAAGLDYYGGKLLLGATTLAVDAATISVASIPAGYRALEIIAWLRGTQNAANIWCSGQLNDDAGNNYDLIQTVADNVGVAKTIQNDSASFAVGIIPAATATAGRFSQVRLFINEYAGGHYKIVGGEVNAVWGTAAGGISHTWDTCGWRSTAAVTKVSLITAANFLAGSKMAVYGLG